MPCGRNSLFLLVILAVWSCDSEPEPVDILTDYEVALTGGKSLRYYYHRMPENDTTWTDYRTLYENEEKYVTEESFAKGLPQSRYKYKVLGTRQEVVEKIFYHLRDSLTAV